LAEWLRRWPSLVERIPTADSFVIRNRKWRAGIWIIDATLWEGSMFSVMMAWTPLNIYSMFCLYKVSMHSMCID
jgi:hypothetical protein